MRVNKGRDSIRNTAMVFVLLTAVWTQPWKVLAQNTQSPAPQPATGVKYPTISPEEMKEWLTYLASDQLQGRQIFTEGYGLAAQYVADHLRQWGVKPLGPDGTYFQPVKLKGYRVTRNSTVTIERNGQARTFKHGDHVTFPTNGGGKQTLTFNSIEFVGLGLATDLQGRDLKDKLVVTIPNLAPAPAGGQRGQAAAPAAGGNAPRGGGARGGSAAAIAQGASAAIGFTATPAAPSAAEQALTQAQAALTQANTALQQAQQALRGGGAGAGGFVARGAAQPAAGADVTTVQRVDGIVTPQFTGDETFFETLFDDGVTKFADILAAARRGEAIAPLTVTAKV